LFTVAGAIGNPSRMKQPPSSGANHASTHPLSPAAARMLSSAEKSMRSMQLDDAERALTGVLALAADCAEAYRLMGVIAQMRGDHAKAVEYLRDAIAIDPDNATTYMHLGAALYETGAKSEGLDSLRRACELAPASPAAWYNLGKALKLQIEHAAACAALERALQLDPAHVLSLVTLADVQTDMGDIALAIGNYRKALQRDPAQPHAWHSLANLKTEPFTPADVQQLQRALHRPGTSMDATVQLGFALFKALEDQGDFRGAFETLQRANMLKRRTLAWSSTAEHVRVDQIMQTFDAAMPQPVDPALGSEVIFIVSLPRSGSTLLEQILASHPQVEGANEITDFPQVIEDESRRLGRPFPQWANDANAADWHRLGLDYLARTERWRRERPRFTDKNLVTWQLVGAIRAMLPGARIIDCHRDALETCFACYRQLFSNGANFSYDLTEMAEHYADYARLSRHWQALYPQQVFEHSHEQLLADPEARIRQLLDFCQLPFDKACLNPHLSTRTVRSTASAAQVRQPLHAGARPASSRYLAQLQPLREKLRVAGLVSGD
jgi:tetratricopeptide (TPR) repeat protein